MEESLDMKCLKRKRFYEPEIESNFIFEKEKDFSKKEISPIAFMKGEKIGLTYSKSRNLINDNLNLKYDLSQMTPEEFDFLTSREKAKELINTINDIEDKETLLDTIYKSLSYDNTSQYIIYTALKRLFNLGYEQEYYNILKEYKMCISEEMTLENNNKVNINELYPIKNFYITKNKEAIKNVFITIIQSLFLLFNASLVELRKVSVKFKNDNGILSLIEEESNDMLFKENPEILRFFNIYKDIKYIKIFHHNQPIEYELNPILFFYQMINLIYENFLLESKENDIMQVSFYMPKIQQIMDMEEYANNTLLNKLKKDNTYDIVSDIIIKFFIFSVICEIESTQPLPYDNFIIKKESLTKKYTQDFFENKIKNKKTFIEEMKIDEGKFEIKQNKSSFTFKYANYENNILDKIIKTYSKKYLDIIRYRCIYLSEFQKENFFFDKEITYIKDLFREIVKSKSFKELFTLYAEKESLPKDIIRNKYIQNYILDNITFFPYDEKNFDAESLTFSFNGQICISGYPITNIIDYKNTKVYHILEMARKLVQLMHEYFHAFKRYLSIVTNGLIVSETFDKNGDREEAGFLLEYCLFGWQHNDYVNNNLNYKNNHNLWNKVIDVNTALKLLSSELYNYDVASMHEILYNDKTSQSYLNFEKNLDIKLKEFLFDIGFDTEEKIVQLKKDKSTIKASRSNSQFNTIFAGFKCGTNKKKKYF